MKTNKLLAVGLLLVGAMTTFYSCKEDDPSPLTILSIVAEGTDVSSGAATSVDLNGATAAEGVPVDLVVTITFSKEVDATTVSAASVSVNDVAGDLVASGATVTWTATEELPRGTDFVLNIGAVVASDGGAFVATTRNFKTGGRAPVVAPKESSQLAFWKFDNDALDELGTFNPNYEHNITYATDRLGQANSAALFDGDASIIEIPGGDALMKTRSSWTISFWMYMDTLNNLNAAGTAPAGQFPFGLGSFYGVRMEANGRGTNFNLALRWEIDNGVDPPTTRNEGFSFDGSGSYNATGGWRGHTWQSDWRTTGGVAGRIVGKWAHIVFTHDAPTKISSIYINGELVKQQDYNLYSIPGSPHPQENCVGWKYAGTEPTVYNDFVFGFVHSRRGTLWDTESFGNYDSPTSNHFKGMLDDFRIFEAGYSQADVTALYDAEKP